MLVKRLRLKNYRNISSIDLEFESPVTLFVGKNGQGKTNLLESIYLTCRGKGFRWDQSLIRTGEEESSTRANLSINGLDFDVEVALQGNKRVNEKKISLNGKKVSSQELSQKAPVILFSPESLSAIKSGPEERRLLIDDFLITLAPENIQLMSDFRHCLKSRNRVLRDYKAEKISKIEALDLLRSLEVHYLPLAVKLSTTRTEILKEIMPFFEATVREILNESNLQASIRYFISGREGY